jgi:hypothetical protein
MKYALAIVDKPKLDPNDRDGAKTRQHNWEYFLKGDTAPEEFRHVQAGWLLREGVWQIPLANGLPMLSALIVWAHHCSCPCRVLYFDKEPEWIISPGK